MSEQIEKSLPAIAKKSIGKGAIIGGVVFVAAIAAGGGVAMGRTKTRGAAETQQDAGKPDGVTTAEVAPQAATQKAAPVGEGGEETESLVVNMAPFVVNLDDESEEMQHYLKVQVAVQLAAASFNKVFEAHTPKVRNALLFYLSSLKLTDTQGMENKNKILERVRTEVQTSVGKAAIADVFLTEFVIQ